MAAGRLNIPTIVVVCGYQQSGEYRGQHVDIEEVFLKSGYVASGAITVGELADMADVAVRSPGVCAGMGTANSCTWCVKRSAWRCRAARQLPPTARR